MEKETKRYLFEYYHDGSWWGFELSAYDMDDAMTRLKKLPFAQYDGELIFSVHVPAILRYLFESIADLIVWVRNHLTNSQ